MRTVAKAFCIYASLRYALDFLIGGFAEMHIRRPR